MLTLEDPADPLPGVRLPGQTSADRFGHGGSLPGFPRAAAPAAPVAFLHAARTPPDAHRPGPFAGRTQRPPELGEHVRLPAVFAVATEVVEAGADVAGHGFDGRRTRVRAGLFPVSSSSGPPVSGAT